MGSGNSISNQSLARSGGGRPVKFIVALTAAALLLASCRPDDPPAQTRSPQTAAGKIAAVKSARRSAQTAAAKAPVSTTRVASPHAVASATKTAPAEASSQVVTASLSGNPILQHGRVTELAVAIAGELNAACPIADPNDVVAMERCRGQMLTTSLLRQSLSDFTLWGRQNDDPLKSLADTHLTQFAPDVLTGMYMPLFMFNGRQTVSYNEVEKMYRVELGVAFRNRLAPGQYPYPFWHVEAKWNTYQGANAMLLWIDPASMKVRTAQFTKRGTTDPKAKIVAVPVPAFDGKWMWTDADGKAQPKVTLFDGIFKPENPHLSLLDAAYKELALSLREGQCMSCHSPNNAFKSKKLVLLQTPAHAAAEIKRVMDSVRRDRMPLDDTTGLETSLDKDVKEQLILRASAFEALIDAARSWEKVVTEDTATKSAATEPNAPAASIQN